MLARNVPATDLDVGHGIAADQLHAINQDAGVGQWSGQGSDLPLLAGFRPGGRWQRSHRTGGRHRPCHIAGRIDQNQLHPGQGNPVIDLELGLVGDRFTIDGDQGPRLRRADHQMTALLFNHRMERQDDFVLDDDLVFWGAANAELTVHNPERRLPIIRKLKFKHASLLLLGRGHR